MQNVLSIVQHKSPGLALIGQLGSDDDDEDSSSSDSGASSSDDDDEYGDDVDEDKDEG